MQKNVRRNQITVYQRLNEQFGEADTVEDQKKS